MHQWLIVTIKLQRPHRCCTSYPSSFPCVSYLCLYFKLSQKCRKLFSEMQHVHRIAILGKTCSDLKYSGRTQREEGEDDFSWWYCLTVLVNAHNVQQWHLVDCALLPPALPCANWEQTDAKTAVTALSFSFSHFFFFCSQCTNSLWYGKHAVTSGSYRETETWRER